MTRGEAKALFLRYLGAATLNGTPRDEPDLADAFEALLYPALVQVGALYPPRETAEVQGRFEAPEELIAITRTFDERGAPVAYTRVGERTFWFDAPCTAEYTRRPAAPEEGEDAPIDLDERAAQLVPLQIAINAAAASPENAWQVPYLTASYNALHAALDSQHAVTFRRVNAV